MSRRLAGLSGLTATVLLVGLPARAVADDPRPKAPPAPWFIDDAALIDRFTAKLSELAARKKCLPSTKLKALAAADRTCRVVPTRPGPKRLDPEDVYDAALPGVFLVGSVVKDGDGYGEGSLATAWVLAADGVLVTNWHVFDGVEDGEVFGAMNHKGEVFPLTDLIGVNRAADVAVFRIAATGLTPLPVADTPARVGAWVGVLGHPGDRYFTFSQGHVTRYSTTAYDDGLVERWMAVTAEYAIGASGAPVLDRRGAVIGMAAVTETIDAPEETPAELPRGDKPKDGKEKKPPQPIAVGSVQQMVVKLTTPADQIRRLIQAE